MRHCGHPRHSLTSLPRLTTSPPTLALTFTLALAACVVDPDATSPHGCSPPIDPSRPDAAGPDAAGPDAPLAPAHRFEPLLHTTYVDGERVFPVTLARVHRPDGGRTYVQWIHSDARRPGPRPVVVMTMPYAGIDWTGEELDARWAATIPGPDGYPDVDGPDDDGLARIAYEPTSIIAAADQARPHLINDFAILLVYGRYYAGGDVRDDIADMRAGMWFLAEQPGIDTTRIGVIGASWGGFEALHASAAADPRAPAAVTVALYPPVDFATWVHHAVTRTDPARGALIPYVRRIHAATGGPPDAPGTDYTGLRTADLCANLPAATLVLHDDVDNLVPIDQSETLVATCGADAVYWRRAADPDPGAVTHGPITEEPGLPSSYLYAWTYLHRRIAQPGQQLLEPYSAAAFALHIATIHDAQSRGEDITFAAPRLLELCDPRLGLYDIATATVRPGPEVVAAAINTAWGTSHTAATISAALALGLPQP